MVVLLTLVVGGCVINVGGDGSRVIDNVGGDGGHIVIDVGGHVIDNARGGDVVIVIGGGGRVVINVGGGGCVIVDAGGGGHIVVMMVVVDMWCGGWWKMERVRRLREIFEVCVCAYVCVHDYISIFNYQYFLRLH